MITLKKALVILFIAFLVFACLPALAEEAPSDGEMPDWYPENVDEWEFTPASPDAPRVVDDADILTDEEEAAISARIAEVSAKNAADIVVFTDVSTHGLERAVYAADFYDFNGYGIGPEHDGFCLFICMDPQSRGGWCCVTGSRPRSLYTEENANDIDDVLYSYLGSGRYFDGIYDWVGNIGTLLEKGYPFAPEWFPSINEPFVRTHDTEAPRVVDDGHVFTADQVKYLEEKAAAISQKYGVDVVVHTTDNTYGLTRKSYTDAFFRYRGYGLGDSFEGTQLTLFTQSRSSNMYSSPGLQDKLNDRNTELLLEAVADPAEEGDLFKAADRWLSYLDRTLKTGRVPRTPIVWAIRSAFAGVISIIGSAISSSKAKRSMRTVRTAYEASDHLVRDRLMIGGGSDIFTHTTESRVYSPIVQEREGHSGGGGGGSSYSGGYSGSSGTSHSGSGRDF